MQQDAEAMFIPEGVAHIGAKAFENCSSLQSVSIPNGVTSIGESAFYGCGNLVNVEIPDSVVSIGNWAFSYCALEEVKLPRGLVSISEDTFSWSSIQSISIPDGVTSIEPFAFYHCGSLQSVEIPDSVTSIGMAAFNFCASLESVEVPESVTSIGVYALGFDLAYNGGKVPGFTIYGAKGSLAEMYAKENGFLFESGSGSIVKTNIAAATVTLEESSYIYDGSPKAPAVTVKLGGRILKKGTDYIVFYNNNINVGTANVVVRGKGNYKGTVTKEFTITEAPAPEQKAKELSKCTITISQASYNYDGTAKKPTVTVKDGSKTLIENTDYTITYGNNVNVGTAKVTVTGKGNYTGTVTKEFTITASAPPKQEGKELSKCTVTLRKVSYAYDGNAKKPTATVKDGATALKEGTDYTVAYSNNVNAGTAKVTVTGKGNYKGTVTKSFTITIKKGTSHKAGPYQYKVAGASTVSVTKVQNNKITKIKIPKTVKIGGKVFKVTAIASRAFRNNKKITSIEMGDNVKVIGASAFEGCTKLGRATLGKGITEIGGNAFKNCKKLGTITIKSTKLKKVGRNALKGIKATARVKVPAKKLSAYKRLLKNKGQGKKVKIVK